MSFNKRLNYNPIEPHKITEEVVLDNNMYEGILLHGNVVKDSVVVKDANGNVISNVSLESLDDKQWNYRIIIQAPTRVAFIHYESKGDTVDADDINEIHDAIRKLRFDLENIDIPEVDLTPIENAIDELNNIKADKQFVTGEINSLTKIITDTQNIINTHIDSKANPHKVTKAQVGLGNVDNTSDKDKPVSNAVQAALYKMDAHIQNLRDMMDNELEQKADKSYVDEQIAQIDLGDGGLAWEDGKLYFMIP